MHEKHGEAIFVVRDQSGAYSFRAQSESIDQNSIPEAHIMKKLTWRAENQSYINSLLERRENDRLGGKMQPIMNRGPAWLKSSSSISTSSFSALDMMGGKKELTKRGSVLTYDNDSLERLSKNKIKKMINSSSSSSSSTPMEIVLPSNSQIEDLNGNNDNDDDNPNDNDNDNDKGNGNGYEYGNPNGNPNPNPNNRDSSFVFEQKDSSVGDLDGLNSEEDDDDEDDKFSEIPPPPVYSPGSSASEAPPPPPIIPGGEIISDGGDGDRPTSMTRRQMLLRRMNSIHEKDKRSYAEIKEDYDLGADNLTNLLNGVEGLDTRDDPTLLGHDADLNAEVGVDDEIRLDTTHTMLRILNDAVVGGLFEKSLKKEVSERSGAGGGGGKDENASQRAKRVTTKLILFHSIRLAPSSLGAVRRGVLQLFHLREGLQAEQAEQINSCGG